jgi:hypothetical protein
MMEIPTKDSGFNKVVAFVTEIKANLNSNYKKNVISKCRSLPIGRTGGIVGLSLHTNGEAEQSLVTHRPLPDILRHELPSTGSPAAQF